MIKPYLATRFRKKKLIVFLTVVVSGLLIFWLWLTNVCNFPICQSNEQRYSVDQEIVDQVQPYLDAWISMPAEDTEAQRAKTAEEHDLQITIGDWTKSNGEVVTVVYIEIEYYFDWTKGMIFAGAEQQLIGSEKFQLEAIGEGLYVFNSNF